MSELENAPTELTPPRSVDSYSEGCRAHKPTAKYSHDRSYVLATAAYNEEKLIEKVIQSVVNQTLTPKKWVIVNDGSSDCTAEIVQNYAKIYSFIELYTISEPHPRDPTAQVHAINRGFAQLQRVECTFIGNLDADITLKPHYFERLIEEFRLDPRLALAGGFIYEEQDGKFRSRRTNVESSVAHAVQLFRRECLEELGGYKPFTRGGGADWYAEVSLRMKGWHARSIPELEAFHHRPTGRGFGLLKYAYRAGVMDFYMGAHPLFEVLKLAGRMSQKPYVVTAASRLSGFLSGYWNRIPRQVPTEFISYLRQEQMTRIRARLGAQPF